MVTIIGDPDGVPESGVRPRVELGNVARGLRWLVIAPLSVPDPAALLGPVREPADWNPRDAAGDEEC